MLFSWVNLSMYMDASPSLYRVGRFNPPPGLNQGLTRVGLNPLFGLNWAKPGLN